MRSSVTHVLETRRHGVSRWEPVLDRERKRVTFDGPSGKAQAITFAIGLTKLPTYDGVNVVRWIKKTRETHESVAWQWTQQGGISA